MKFENGSTLFTPAEGDYVTKLIKHSGGFVAEHAYAGFSSEELRRSQEAFRFYDLAVMDSMREKINTAKVEWLKQLGRIDPAAPVVSVTHNYRIDWALARAEWRIEDGEVLQVIVADSSIEQLGLATVLDLEASARALNHLYSRGENSPEKALEDLDDAMELMGIGLALDEIMQHRFSSDRELASNHLENIALSIGIITAITGKFGAGEAPIGRQS